MRHEVAMYRLNEFVSVFNVILGMHDKIDIPKKRNAFTEIMAFYCQYNNKIKNYLHYRLPIPCYCFQQLIQLSHLSLHGELPDLDSLVLPVHTRYTSVFTDYLPFYVS